MKFYLFRNMLYLFPYEYLVTADTACVAIESLKNHISLRDLEFDGTFSMPENWVLLGIVEPVLGSSNVYNPSSFTHIEHWTKVPNFADVSLGYKHWWWSSTTAPGSFKLLTITEQNGILVGTTPDYGTHEIEWHNKNGYWHGRGLR